MSEEENIAAVEQQVKSESVIPEETEEPAAEVVLNDNEDDVQQATAVSPSEIEPTAEDTVADTEVTLTEPTQSVVEVATEGAAGEEEKIEVESKEQLQKTEDEAVEVEPEPPAEGEEKEEKQEAVVEDEVKAEEAPLEEGEKPEVNTDGEEHATPTVVLQETKEEVKDELSETVVLPEEQLSSSPLLFEEQLPEPGTPERPGSPTEEEILMAVEEEEEMEPQYNRDELIQQYQAALHEREQLNQQNRLFQHKLSDYFRKKKTEDVKPEADKTTIDQEQRYIKYMSNLEELRQQQATEMEEYNDQLEEMREKKLDRQQKVEEEWAKAMEFKRAIAMQAINSRTGRPIPVKDIDMFELNERKKEVEVSQVRLENIKLKNRLKKQENQLKQKEELAEGLHLIDFEQLKIENQTYNEKIEERNEELLKLRKKITNTVQVLTHLKEKLQFVQAENSVKSEQLSIVEREVAQKRDILSRTKQARDSLRHENNKLQQKCGLLGNTDLLRDFEYSTDEVTDLEHRLDMLKRTHAELTLSLNGIKKKIELAKDNQS